MLSDLLRRWLQICTGSSRQIEANGGTKRLLVVHFHCASGWTSSESVRLNKAISKTNPLWVEFLAPSGIVSMFDITRSGVPTGQSDWRRLLLLELEQPQLVQIGIAEGDMIVQTDEAGKVVHLPMGEAGYEACRLACSNTE